MAPRALSAVCSLPHDLCVRQWRTVESSAEETGIRRNPSASMTETSPGITTEKSDAIAGFLRELRV